MVKIAKEKNDKVGTESLGSGVKFKRWCSKASQESDMNQRPENKVREASHAVIQRTSHNEGAASEKAPRQQLAQLVLETARRPAQAGRQLAREQHWVTTQVGKGPAVMTPNTQGTVRTSTLTRGEILSKEVTCSDSVFSKITLAEASARLQGARQKQLPVITMELPYHWNNQWLHSSSLNSKNVNFLRTVLTFTH